MAVIVAKQYRMFSNLCECDAHGTLAKWTTVGKIIVSFNEQYITPGRAYYFYNIGLFAKIIDKLIIT